MTSKDELRQAFCISDQDVDEILQSEMNDFTWDTLDGIIQHAPRTEADRPIDRIFSAVRHAYLAGCYKTLKAAQLANRETVDELLLETGCKPC